MNSAFAKHFRNSISWLWLLITLLVFSALIKLGLWQSARADEKDQRLAKITSLSTAEQLTTDDIATLAHQDINDLPVKLSGFFDNDKTILLDNQTHKGIVGYRVLKVFRESATNRNILVNLGWIAGGKLRNILPTVDAIEGKHEISGHVRIVENTIMLAEDNINTNSWPKRVQAIDIESIGDVSDYTLAPYVVYLSKDADIGYEKNWQPIVMPPEKHRAYAFQWFSLALAWLALMCWAAYHNSKKIRAGGIS